MVAMHQPAQPRRRGRPRKNAEKREYFGFYVPPELAELIRERAEEQGSTYSDVIGRALAESFGFAWTSAYTKPGTKNQEELPLADTA